VDASEKEIIDQLKKYDEKIENKAKKIWDSSKSTRTETHPYILDNGINEKTINQHVKYIKNSIVLPVYNVDNELKSLQFISNTTGSQFLTGRDISGLFSIIGELGSSTIIICDDLLNAAAVNSVTGKTVVICFSDDNLQSVADNINNKYRGCNIIVASCLGFGKNTSYKIIKSDDVSFHDLQPEEILKLFDIGHLKTRQEWHDYIEYTDDIDGLLGDIKNNISKSSLNNPEKETLFAGYRFQSSKKILKTHLQNRFQIGVKTLFWTMVTNQFQATLI